MIDGARHLTVADLRPQPHVELLLGGTLCCVEVLHASREAGLRQVASPFIEPGIKQRVPRVKENGANAR
jgi:hypothetical protein